MHLALKEAQAAADAGDVPVGAVAVVDGAVVGLQRNRKEELNDPTHHGAVRHVRRCDGASQDC
jgi:tRNA(Arg) A34 adenosine deaminase TadA